MARPLHVRADRRRYRVAGFSLASLLVAALLAGCGADSAPGSTSGASPSPSPSSGPAAVIAGSFADLPFTLDMPEGWVFGNAKDVAAGLAAIAKSDSADAKKLQAILAQTATPTSGFVAYDVGGQEAFVPGVGCTTVGLGSLSAADALAEGQVQNVDALAQWPGIIGKPVGDRMTLPVGETVRVRWRWTNAADGTDATSIGYLFVAGPTVYTCVFSAGTPTVATHQPEWEAILRTFAVKPSASPSTTPTGAPTAECPAPGDGFAHQAPEIEAILPSVVAGRPLTRWSVRGRCWLEMLFVDTAAIDPFVAQFATAGNPNPVDDANLVYGVAGRSIDTDPPFFVFAAVRPSNNDEIGLAMYLLLGGSGFKPGVEAADLTYYQAQTIAGKEVHVGSVDMLTQDTHLRGRPYLYQTEEYMFLVITEDDVWAADAIDQLP